jgi:hypothetical protein
VELVDMGGVTGPVSPADTALTALLTDYGYYYLIVKDRHSGGLRAVRRAGGEVMEAATAAGMRVLLAEELAHAMPGARRAPDSAGERGTEGT